MNANEQTRNTFDLIDFIVEIDALHDLIASLMEITEIPAEVSTITPNSNKETMNEAQKAIDQYNKINRLISAMFIISSKVTSDVSLLERKLTERDTNL